MIIYVPPFWQECIYACLQKLMDPDHSTGASVLHSFIGYAGLSEAIDEIASRCPLCPSQKNLTWYTLALRGTKWAFRWLE